MKNDSQFLKNGINRCVVSSSKTIRFLPVIFFVIFSQLSFAQLPQFDDFEGGLIGIWNDGGNDCGLVFNTLLGGNRNVQLRDNSGVASSLFSDPLDLTAYTSVTIQFQYITRSFENGENFFVEYNDGGGWAVIGNYVRNVDFNNNVVGSISITIASPGFNLTNNARFRIRADASDNGDRLNIDNINIFETPPPPANDECINAITLSTSEFCLSTTGTTFLATQSQPGCSGTADDDVWYTFIATDTTHDITVESLTINDIVFEVFDSCGGSSILCEDSTSGFSNETASLSSLTVGNQYFIRIYSAPGNPNDSGDFTICVVDPCEPSTATGSTDLGCPSVDAGGLGQSGGDTTLSCAVGSTDLEADYLELGETTSYTVEAIPFNPPFQFGCLANPVSIGQDDVFSPVINLPFDFCFYGNTYNSCVIGSNGVISFDTSLANTASGWRILQNLPTNAHAYDFAGGLNAYDFGPSIHGVHHDVDPSIGGEIGYQLITLDTGCRAFVASWKDVPMYFNNSILYTGMMVFYEDTNVIEVYIKEKNIDGTWNNGRAVLGITDSPERTVIPGRNGLDAPWTATDEAWRFTPNGASITTLRWYENAIAPGNEIIDPDDDGVITVSPFNTTTYFAEVTYTLCDGSTIVESDATTVTVTGTKTWNGSSSTAWENPNNWTPVGVPLPVDCIVIPATGNDPVMAGTTDGTGLTLSIEDGATLTQSPNSTLTIEDDISIEPLGDFEIQDDASVIQITDVATNQNTGTARFQREVTGVDYFDYVYWSSPVDAYNLEDISPGTPAFAMYEWTPTTVNGTAGNHGNWLNTSGNMSIGQGYIVRGLLGGALANTAEFQGVLNNGQVSVPISRGSYTGADYPGLGNTATAEDDNWNLLGNPYPSAISLTDFTAANPDIDGTLYFWRHLTPTSDVVADPFFEDYVYNYSASDYLTANSLGSTPPGHNGFIAAGQGFFALMLDSAPTTSTVVFNNTMRGTYDNSGFYRSSSVTTSNTHRIWLDFVNNSNSSANSILVGYVNGATHGIDRLYDGYSINDSSQQFYSWITNEKLAINGRPLPFDDTDIINLGFEAPENGNYSITINALDGLFSETNQTIYLEDKTLDIIHDLRLNPYSFTSEAGRFDERFVLRFTAEALSTPEEELVDALSILKIRDDISVESTQATITSFELIDMQGRIIHKNFSLNTLIYNYNTQGLSRGTYLVRVALNNGSTQVKKLII